MHINVYLDPSIAIADEEVAEDITGVWARQGITAEVSVRRDSRVTDRQPLVVIDGAGLTRAGAVA